MPRLARLPLLVAVALTTAACPGDENSPPSPAIAMALSTSSVSLAQGANQTITVTITRTNFTQAVALTIEGLPTGVTAAFAPASVPDGTGSSALTLTAAASAAPGSATLTVKAAGTGITEQSATIALTITVTGSYSLSMNPTSRTVIQGNSATSAVTITRTGGFAGSVALAVSGAPAGLTTSLDNASTTGSTATLTMNASATATVGTHTLTITGTSPGLANQTTTISVTIQAPPALTSVTMAICAQTGESIHWVGYQNEGAAWVQLVPNANNLVTFQATPKVAVRFVHGSGFFANDLLYMTAAELQTFPTTCDHGTRTLNGSVANVPSGQVADVTIGFNSQRVTPPATTFSVGNLPASAVDLIALRTSLSGNVANTVIIRRDITTASGGTLPVLDFGGSEATALASANLTVTGLVAGETNTADVSFMTSGQKGQSSIWQTQFTGTAGTTAFQGVPSGSTIAGDSHILIADAATSTSNRTAMAFFRTMGDKSIALGPALSSPTVTLVPGSPVRYRVQLASQAEYNSFINWGVNQSGRDLWTTVSAAYLGGTPTTWDVTQPDMTGAPGWNPTWGLQTGETPRVFAGAASGGLNLVTSSPGTDGTTARFAEREVSNPPSSMIVGAARGAQRGRKGPVVFGSGARK